MKWWFSIINAWNPLLINYCPWNLKNHLKIHVDCEFGVPKSSNLPAWAICCCCYIISKIIGYSKIGKIVQLQVVNFEIISSIWGADNQRVGLTFLKLHFFEGNFRFTVRDVRTWLEKFLIHIEELNQSKTSKSKKLHFSFQGQSH